MSSFQTAQGHAFKWQENNIAYICAQRRNNAPVSMETQNIHKLNQTAFVNISA